MKTGRKSKPTALKLLESNPGRRDLPKPAPVFDSTKPSPPPFLNDDALQEWYLLIDILFETGVMTKMDRAAFAAYCQSYGRWVQAERQIAKLQEKNELNGLVSGFVWRQNDSWTIWIEPRVKNHHSYLTNGTRLTHLGFFIV